MAEKEKYGLIAGNGRFPFLVLQSAREQGIDVVVAAIKEETLAEIETCGYPFTGWDSVNWKADPPVPEFRCSKGHHGRPGKACADIRIFFPGFDHDPDAGRIKAEKYRCPDRGVARVLEESGISLVDSTVLLKPFLAIEGKLTRRGLNAAESSDVDYGRPIAHRIASMDLGQTIVVRDRAVVAVEAMEGTDAVIMRAGELVNRKDLTVIKVSKPKQDMRFDIPVVGPQPCRRWFRPALPRL